MGSILGTTNPFVQALTDRTAYDLNNYPTNTDFAGDVNGDGSFNLGDVGALKALLNNPTAASAAAVPEPTTLLLMMIAVVSLLGRRRKKLYVS